MTVTFGLIRLLPGGPFTRLRTQMLAAGMDPQTVNKQIENLQNIRPDSSLPEQYANYMLSALQGDLGMSISKGDPVVEILASAAPWTIFIVVVSTVLMFTFGILIGSLQAYWEGSRFDKIFSSVSIAVMAVPFYVVAILALLVFSYRLGWFPATGPSDVGLDSTLSFEFFLSVLHHNALPIFSYTITGIGAQALSMRGNSIQVLGRDYVRVARLRGLPDSRIASRYVARNAILPLYTGFLLLIGFRLGGTVILERIFNIPGLGFYLFDSVNANDYPLMMGTFLVITVTLVIGVFIADLTYGMIDPRISAGGSNEAY